MIKKKMILLLLYLCIPVALCGDGLKLIADWRKRRSRPKVSWPPFNPDDWLPIYFAPGSSIDLEALNDDECAVPMPKLNGWQVYVKKPQWEIYCSERVSTGQKE